VSFELSIPVAAVLGIYARETGQGMIFGEDDAPASAAPPDGEEPPPPPPSPPAGKPRAKLKVIK
jgi:stringent starvation protein B